jgi:hypothetical protein
MKNIHLPKNQLLISDGDNLTYDSFGKLTASTGSLVNSFRYTAHESDTEMGLYYYPPNTTILQQDGSSAKIQSGMTKR